eukprot:363013-Chlamydomonas_euryale.AAC.4
MLADYTEEFKATQRAGNVSSTSRKMASKELEQHKQEMVEDFWHTEEIKATQKSGNLNNTSSQHMLDRQGMLQPSSPRGWTLGVVRGRTEPGQHECSIPLLRQHQRNSALQCQHAQFSVSAALNLARMPRTGRRARGRLVLCCVVVF